MNGQDNKTSLLETKLQNSEDELDEKTSILSSLEYEEKGDLSSQVVKLVSEELDVNLSPEDRRTLNTKSL
jgi:hypothetical protein